MDAPDLSNIVILDPGREPESRYTCAVCSVNFDVCGDNGGCPKCHQVSFFINARWITWKYKKGAEHNDAQVVQELKRLYA